MPEQFGEKVHEPTPRRRQQAREKGQVARSQDLASALLLVAATGALLMLGGEICRFLGVQAQRHLAGELGLRIDAQSAAALGWQLAVELAWSLLPLLGLMFAVAVLVHVGQVGLLFLPDKLAPELRRISPLAGLKRIFSMANLVRLAFGLFKIGVVASVGLWSLWDEREKILALTQLDVPAMALYVVQLAVWTTLKIGLALVVLAILDYAWQYWRHEQELRMTHQELREEAKVVQGDPQILARRRAIQRQLVMARMRNAVPQADVVVTNPTELAVAIRYDAQRMAAPTVVAKGAGLIAQRIRRLALEHNVPVVERKQLARTLYRDVQLNQPIPLELYAAVAEVLRYVYQLQGKQVA